MKRAWKGGKKEGPKGLLVPSPVAVTVTRASKPDTDQYQFPFVLF